jgi:prepilin-type N-terminal cleavage/methylation domain-containing protein
MQNKNKLRLQNFRGFTLLEMVVSVSIFTIVMTISIGAILTLDDSLQKAKTMRAAVENVSFALEGMAKKIRTGDYINCLAEPTNGFEILGVTNDVSPRDCPNGGKRITFKYDEQNQFVSYQFRSGAIEVGTYNILRTPPEESNNVLTGSDVTIEDMKFYVTGACPPETNRPGKTTYCSSADNQQPLVRITLTGKANLGKTSSETRFTIQTTVSPRVLDN